ncbi:ThuA domain-containing protein [Sediminibacterium roseum]|uniref:ThuA domain-containing protein n=1 Tax=Sediminibacterium roseum TaxID=1978412 RepID=A0ABW9ZRF2_9BACT|nr:ThuA domain-containing protein [Sediminibacterium roseum]NCI49679.1 ThuA domain-containing protein [Sediminibacterium roseum]
MIKRVFLQNCFLFFALSMAVSQLNAADGKLRGSRVLVYTKNGKGYVHDNIPSAVACIKALGAANGFTVDVADTSLVFTEENLKKYNLLIFTSTNNDVFATDAQRVAFRRYIEAGGGFVGVHSVTGTERNWTWFKQMLGETFTWHAKNQKFTVKKLDGDHPSMQGVPAMWERKDECYFGKELYPGIKVLMAHVVSSLDMHERSQDSLLQKNLGSYKDYFPAVWYQQFQGGNIWVTTLGHDKENYQDPVYINHLLQGIKYIASQFRGIDYAKAYATGKDDQLR